MSITLIDLSDILITPYEEICVRVGGDVVLARDMYATDGARLVGETDLLSAHGGRTVAGIDCYYTGDHMAVDLTLL